MIAIFEACTQAGHGHYNLPSIPLSVSNRNARLFAAALGPLVGAKCFLSDGVLVSRILLESMTKYVSRASDKARVTTSFVRTKTERSMTIRPPVA